MEIFHSRLYNNLPIFKSLTEIQWGFIKRYEKNRDQYLTTESIALPERMYLEQIDTPLFDFTACHGNENTVWIEPSWSARCSFGASPQYFGLDRYDRHHISAQRFHKLYRKLALYVCRNSRAIHICPAPFSPTGSDTVRDSVQHNQHP